jgi:thiol:disulfide interchange protein DsbD
LLLASIALWPLTGAAQSPTAPAELLWDERLAASLRSSLAGGHLGVSLLAAWVGGLLTSFTPCVWPLIPITVRFFAAMQGVSRRQVVRLALVYVAGMTLLYATLGVVFAASGVLFGSLLASPLFAGAMAVLCAAMAVSMLGVFTVQLPSALATRLSQVGGRSVGGALVMGLVSGLIAAPCTGPVLAVVLALVASSGQILLGLVLMVAFSLGLGLPFLVLAIVSGKRIPTSGLWMDVVKTVLATAMLGVAVYFLQIAAPVVGELVRAVPFGAFVGLISILVGLALGALLFNLHGRPVARVIQGVTIALLTLGVTLAVMGTRVTTTDPGVPGIRWVSTHDAGMARARAERKPAIIDFTADWCAACKELDRRTYVDQAVRAEATRFVMLKLDATEMTDAMDAIFDRYGVLGLPTVVFIDSAGTILAEPRVTGFVTAERFLEAMRLVH